MRMIYSFLPDTSVPSIHFLALSRLKAKLQIKVCVLQNVPFHFLKQTTRNKAFKEINDTTKQQEMRKKRRGDTGRLLGI